jgi:hypothetical protein
LVTTVDAETIFAIEVDEGCPIDNALVDSEALKMLEASYEEGATEFAPTDALGDTDGAEGTGLRAKVFLPYISSGWCFRGVRILSVSEAFD